MVTAQLIAVLQVTVAQDGAGSLPPSDPGLGMVTRVFIYASITALATGLGALPFLLVRRITSNVVAYSNAVASGLMLGASFGLLAEGTQHGSWQVFVGANAGVLFILATSKWLEGHEVQFGSVQGLGARRMLLIVVVMAVHSFAEGVAVGAAFAGGITLATFVTIAIAVHNIPEGLAISAVLRPRGVSVAACAGWSIVSSLPQPLMAVPSYLFVEAFRPSLPYALGFAAGAMVLMVLLELLPEAYERGRRAPIGMLLTLSLIGMLLFQQYL
ncbi:MAG: ZIP family metal transporter [Planctomycetota bacterium]|jgi:zinc transporter ZupT